MSCLGHWAKGEGQRPMRGIMGNCFEFSAEERTLASRCHRIVRFGGPQRSSQAVCEVCLHLGEDSGTPWKQTQNFTPVSYLYCQLVMNVYVARPDSVALKSHRQPWPLLIGWRQLCKLGLGLNPKSNDMEVEAFTYTSTRNVRVCIYAHS